MNIYTRMATAVCAMALLLPMESATAQRPAPHARPKTAVNGKVKPSATPASPAVNGAAQLTAEDVGAFLDGVVPLQLKRENIAGAVVLVVKDGKVLYAKGYGYSDVKTRKPMTVDDTLVRPGSISKLFTWTAVMQLVQQGKINLDENINDYLDFKIPNTFSKPITMRDLMTHTPGFEESIQDLIAFNAKDVEPLGQYLKDHEPARVFPPGVTPAYSNYGATLAGYIVQRVSGMPFDEYIEKNIFQPLGMQNSTFDQPLPANLKPMMSDGYKLASGKAQPFEFVGAPPAGALSTTAENISHFMIAHLQDGTYNGASILQPATVQEMHARQQYGEPPAMNGMCLGFYEQNRNGQHIIGHGGDTMWFHSDLMLIPSADVGFFVSYNSAGTGQIDPRSALFNQFLTRYFPYTPPAAHPPASAIQDAKMLAGQYRSSRGSFTNIFSFTGLLSEATVTAKPDGTLSSDAFKNLAGVPITFQEIAPLLYRSVDGQDLIAFSRNSHGGWRIWVPYPFVVFDHVSGVNAKSFNMFLIVFVLVVCIVTIVFWPFSAWLRKHYKTPMALTGGQKWHRVVIRVVCILDVLFFIGWLIVMTAGGGMLILTPQIGPWMRLIQIVGWLGSIGTIFVIYSIVRNWGAQRQWWLSHIGNILILCACIGFSWFLYHWHLLHFSMRF